MVSWIVISNLHTYLNTENKNENSHEFPQISRRCLHFAPDLSSEPAPAVLLDNQEVYQEEVDDGEQGYQAAEAMTELETVGA